MRHQLEGSQEGIEPRQNSAVEIDFSELSRGGGELIPPFADAIAKAAQETDQSQPTGPSAEVTKATLRNLQQRDFDKRYADFIANYRNETGYAVTTPAKPIITKPGPKASYELWKRVIPLFVQQPATLDLSLSSLAQLLDKGEANFTVTRGMLYRKMNNFAVRDAENLIKKMGINITLKRPATLASIRTAFRECRDGQNENETFTCKVEIKGDNAYVNGKKFAVQRTTSGERRIRRTGRGWVNLEGLAAICTESG